MKDFKNHFSLKIYIDPCIMDPSYRTLSVYDNQMITEETCMKSGLKQTKD